MKGKKRDVSFWVSYLSTKTFIKNGKTFLFKSHSPFHCTWNHIFRIEMKASERHTQRREITKTDGLVDGGGSDDEGFILR